MIITINAPVQNILDVQREANRKIHLARIL
jgi:hypothetical protein